MIILNYIILSIYILGLCYISVFCFMQLHLLRIYLKHSKKPLDTEDLQYFPMVTVQLPIFNEKYVIERLIDAVAAFNYPKNRFEIRILDDSNDETSSIVARKAAYYKNLGYQIVHVRREKRQGFKAGALRDDMENATGEFLAIFDADFVPDPNFLRNTIPHFSDSKIGVVQTRWGHLNEDYSLLTRLQAFHLNMHFTVEQKGRDFGDYFLQFNGTGGIWRREAIFAGGGWNADTLTEDLDLSMRTQMNGYKIRYLQDVVSPAELPAEMNGYKSQQFRWMKGGAETAKKLLPALWASNTPFHQKIHSSLHLLGSTVFIFIFLVGFFSVPVLLMGMHDFIELKYFTIFIISTLIIVALYYVGNVRMAWKEGPTLQNIIKFLVLLPLSLALGMGLSFHNSIAVIEGFLGKKTAFIRTPKFNIKNVGDTLKNKNYLNSKLSITTILEGFLCLYFLSIIIYAILYGNMTFLGLHALLLIGYGIVFLYSIKHLKYKA